MTSLANMIIIVPSLSLTFSNCEIVKILARLGIMRTNEKFLIKGLEPWEQ